MIFPLILFGHLAQQSWKLTFSPIEDGGIEAAGDLWMMNEIALTPVDSDFQSKHPEMGAARTGKITFGTGSQELAYSVLFAEPPGKKHKDAFGGEIPERLLYVDVNRDGDYFNDPVPKESLSTIESDHKNGHFFEWGMALPVWQGGRLIQGHSNVRYYVPEYPQQGVGGKLLYATDFGLKGTARIGGHTYHTALRDVGPRASFAPYADRSAYLWIDRDEDGRMEYEYEAFPLGKPFTMDGKTYEFGDISPDGATLELKPSTARVLEKPVPKTFIPKVGKAIPSVIANTMNGKTAFLPSPALKGKLVMLDYWATWCGPCLEEIPNLVKAAKRFEPDGLLVTGITLDDPGKEKEIKATASRLGMSWDQIYDGQAWKSPLVTAMRVVAIPAAFLVDGETGEILAMGKDLRGAKLQPTLLKVLAARKSAHH